MTPDPSFSVEKHCVPIRMKQVLRWKCVPGILDCGGLNVNTMISLLSGSMVLCRRKSVIGTRSSYFGVNYLTNVQREYLLVGWFDWAKISITMIWRVSYVIYNNKIYESEYTHEESHVFLWCWYQRSSLQQEQHCEIYHGIEKLKETWETKLGFVAGGMFAWKVGREEKYTFELLIYELVCVFVV